MPQQLRKDQRLSCCGIIVTAGTSTDGLSFDLGSWHHVGPCPGQSAPQPDPSSGTATTAAPVATAPVPAPVGADFTAVLEPGTADLVVVRQGKVRIRSFGFPKSDVQFLADYICRNLLPIELEMLLHEAKRLRLNPTVQKQIIAVVYSKNDPSKRTLSIQLGLSGYQAIAARSGSYDGNNEVEDGPEVTTVEETQSGKKSIKHPEWCRATVWRIGASHPFVAKVRWDERKKIEFGKLSDKWATNPYTMLEACAERSALRKGFPLEIGDLDAQDEAPIPVDHEDPALEGHSRTVGQDNEPPVTPATPPGGVATISPELIEVCTEIQSLTEDPSILGSPALLPKANAILTRYLGLKGLRSLHDATPGHIPSLTDLRDEIRKLAVPVAATGGR